MVCLTCLSQWHKFKLFLLSETEMVQNNPVFVQKTSNYSRGRSNLRTDMTQITNLKSLGFTWKKIGGVFTWSFSPGCLMLHRLPWFLWYCFWSAFFFNPLFVGRPCCKTSTICISCWSNDSPTPTLRSSLLHFSSFHLFS